MGTVHVCNERGHPTQCGPGPQPPACPQRPQAGGGATGRRSRRRRRDQCLGASNVRAGLGSWILATRGSGAERLWRWKSCFSLKIRRVLRGSDRTLRMWDVPGRQGARAPRGPWGGGGTCGAVPGAMRRAKGARGAACPHPMPTGPPGAAPVTSGSPHTLPPTRGVRTGMPVALGHPCRRYPAPGPGCSHTHFRNEVFTNGKKHPTGHSRNQGRGEGTRKRPKSQLNKKW